MDQVGAYRDAEERLEYRLDHKKKEFGGSIWVRCNVVCPLLFQGPEHRQKLIEVDVLPCEHLSNGIVQVARIDGYP